MIRPLLSRAAAASFGILLLVSSGCAGGGALNGSRLLRDGRTAEAVEALRQEEILRPQDVQVKHDLGLALMASGDAAGAVAALEAARALDPDRTDVLFALGRAAEDAGQPGTALDAYTAYLARTSKGRAVVESRIQAIALSKAERDVAEALREEKLLPSSAAASSTLAVPDFANVGGADSLAPLSKGLAAIFVSDLSRIPGLRIVERERMRVLQDELGLAAGAPRGGESGADGPAWSAPIGSPRGLKERLAALSRAAGGAPHYAGPIDDARDAALAAALRSFQTEQGLEADGQFGPKTRAALEQALSRAGVAKAEPRDASSAGRGGAGAARKPVDASTAPRLGRLLSAGRFVQGAFVGVEPARIQLDAALVPVTSGTATPVGPPVAGPLDEILQLEKDLLFQTLDALGFPLPAKSRRALAPVETESFSAFLAFSRGIDFEERGMPAEAQAAFREALRIDPGFRLAKTHDEALSVTPEQSQALDEALLQPGGPEPGSAADRLTTTGTLIGLGPGPDLDRDAAHDPSPNAATKLATDAQIVVEGPLPPGKRPR